MIEIPDFADPRLGALTVCCHLRTKDQAILDAIKALPSSNAPMAARVARGKNRLIVSLFGKGAGADADHHLHVDIHRAPTGGRKMFLEPPKVNAKPAEIQTAIEQFSGQTAAAALVASFFVPVDNLPRDRGLIGPTIAPTKAGGTEIRQTQAALIIGGGPIEGIDWIVRPDGKEVWVQLETRSETKIGDHYLTVPYDSLNAAFRLLILGERPHGITT